MAQLQLIPLNGQSNFDLCLQAVGGLDGFMKFCRNNSISITSKVKETPYIYNSNDTENSNFVGYPYNTGFLQLFPVYVTEDGSSEYSTEDGQSVYIPTL